MLQNAVTAFARQDAHLAEVTELVEEQVDGLRKPGQQRTDAPGAEQSNPFGGAHSLDEIARRFERVSDQAKSICQENDLSLHRWSMPNTSIATSTACCSLMIITAA